MGITVINDNLPRVVTQHKYLLLKLFSYVETQWNLMNTYDRYEACLKITGRPKEPFLTLSLLGKNSDDTR